MFISTEVEVENISRRKQVYRLSFNVDEIPVEELAWILKTFRKIKKAVKGGVKPIEEIRELVKETDKILEKASRGGPGRPLNPLLLDPAMRAVTHLIISHKGYAGVGLWWCDGGARGKLFTEKLCKDPAFDYSGDERYHIGAVGRRAVAVNPWSLGDLGDLDTIIDSRGCHKEGTIGKKPFSFTRSKSSTSGTISASFTAKSTATIKSIILLIATRFLSGTERTCYDYNPAPPGTCHGSKYASVYLPLWGWDVSFSVSPGDIYVIKIKFYV